MTGTMDAVPALRRLLDLLASGAATEDFGDVLAEARRQGAQAHVLTEIDDATRLALRVHRTMRQYQCHEAELTALHDTANAALQAHDRLDHLVLRGHSGADVADVAVEVAALLGAAVAVHDAEGVLLAGRPTPRELLADAVAASRAEGRAVPHGDRWVCAVVAGQEPLGSLVLHGRPDLDDAGRQLLERARVVTALLLLLRRSAAQAENRIRGDLLTDLLSAPGRDPAGLTARGRKLGVDLNRPHLVLVAETVPQHRAGLADAAARHLLGTRGISARGISVEHGEAVVLLMPHNGSRSPDRVAEQAADRLGRLVGAPVTVGAGRVAAGPVALAASHAEGLRCVRALRALGREGGGASTAGLGFLGVLLGDGHNIAAYVGGTLGPLLEYDARRGTELVRTLRAYFDCGGSLTRAKEELQVHVNTVVQRLDRVAVLLGHDWNHPERSLELQLALRLHLLTDAGGATDG